METDKTSGHLARILLNAHADGDSGVEFGDKEFPEMLVQVIRAHAD